MQILKVPRRSDATCLLGVETNFNETLFLISIMFFFFTHVLSIRALVRMYARIDALCISFDALELVYHSRKICFFALSTLRARCTIYRGK